MGKAYISHTVGLNVLVGAEARLTQRQSSNGKTCTFLDDLTCEVEYDYL